MSKDPQATILNFAIKELNKIVQDLKNGKQPEMSPILQKLSQEIEDVDPKKMSEKDTEVFAEKLVETISKSED